MPLKMSTFAALAIALAACQKAAPTAGEAAAKVGNSESERSLYALGAMLGIRVADLQLTPGELAQVQLGLADEARGAVPQVDLGVYTPKAEQLSHARRLQILQAAAVAQKAKDAAFVSAAAAESGAQMLDGGLVFKQLAPLGVGQGESPKDSDRVSVRYKTALAGGTVFDDSDKRGGEVHLAVAGVIPCWREALETMKVGERARLVCPPELAYGDRGRPPAIPPGATLAIDLELLAINPVEPPQPPKKPRPPEPAPSPAPN